MTYYLLHQAVKLIVNLMDNHTLKPIIKPQKDSVLARPRLQKKRYLFKGSICFRNARKKSLGTIFIIYRRLL